ncbi:hypothetical protein [Sanyastnella coralliicola]|uniref:hypothetical protein n=1 Tax=Sanyastnella coralliicola TaxID=3069118 RepID=UPI0027B98E20|nr:hypothetical protein [Longitalea sp. SCSIO 12813]
MKKTILFPLCALLFACSTPDPQKEALGNEAVTYEEQEAIEEVVEEQQEVVEQAAPEARRVSMGNVQGEAKGFYNNGALAKADLYLETETGPEEDTFIFDESGKLIFSTHRSLTRNFAGKDGAYVIEHKLYYDDNQQIVSALIRHGKPISENELTLQGKEFENDNPDMEAMNDTYLPRLKECLSSLGQESLLK